MGCDKYYLQGFNYPIMVSEGQDEISCLCTFPDSGVCKERLRSLAYLGAAVVLMSRDKLPHGFLPACLPEDVRGEIDQHFNL